MPKDLKNNLLVSIPFVIIAGVFAALQGALVKYELKKIAIGVIFFFRFSIGLFLITVWTVSTAKPAIVSHLLKTSKIKLLVIRSLTGASATLLYYFGLKYGTLSSATILFQTIPIFVPFVVRIWLKIKIDHRLWWGLGLAFLGIIFILRPAATFFDKGSIIALGSGVLGSISSVAGRVLHYSESTQRITWYYFFFSSVYALLFFLGSIFSTPLVLERNDYLILALIGAAGFLFQFFFLSAMRFSPARLITPFIYFSMIFTVLLDVFYFNTHLVSFEVLGMILIIVGVVLNVFLYR